MISLGASGFINQEEGGVRREKEEGVSPGPPDLRVGSRPLQVGGWGGAKKDKTSGRERRDRRERRSTSDSWDEAHMGVVVTWREGLFLSHFHYCCLMLKNTKRFNIEREIHPTFRYGFRSDERGRGLAPMTSSVAKTPILRSTEE